MVDKTTDNKLRIISLFRSNYLAQYHVRGMAKLTKKSHVTLLPHLKALENDKILAAKTIGKNKVYSLNFDNLIAKDYLLFAETSESIMYLEEIFLIKKILSEIFSLNLAGTLVLFGSYAKRTFKEDSDIDLFCIGKITSEEIQEISAIGKTYGKIINMKKSTLKSFELGLRMKDPLITEIIKSHILLQNSEAFIDALWRYYGEIRG